jgi:hypothetical protein
MLKESESNVIDLFEDDPEAARAMIRYLYHFDYTDANTEDLEDVGKMLLSVKVCREYLLVYKSRY